MELLYLVEILLSPPPGAPWSAEQEPVAHVPRDGVLCCSVSLS